jgi:hypothetical protein
MGNLGISRESLANRTSGNIMGAIANLENQVDSDG